jgi:hypothetical protein
VWLLLLLLLLLRLLTNAMLRRSTTLCVLVVVLASSHHRGVPLFCFVVGEEEEQGSCGCSLERGATSSRAEQHGCTIFESAAEQEVDELLRDEIYVPGVTRYLRS